MCCLTTSLFESGVNAREQQVRGAGSGAEAGEGKRSLNVGKFESVNGEIWGKVWRTCCWKALPELW